MYLAWFCLSDVNSSIWGLISNTTLGPSGHGKKPPLLRLGTLCSPYRQMFMTKIHVFRVVMLVRCRFKRWGSISNTTLRLSGHGKKPPSSRLETVYNYDRQWFMTKIHVFSLVLFVRRQFKHLGLILSTTLGPSGHGKKPPSLRLGTLYNHYRQMFMTKIHVLRVVLFVRRQFNHCVLISNTTLGPSGSRMKPPSSRLRTLYSYYRQWFMTKIHMLRVVLHVRRQFKRCMSISNTQLGPSGRDLKPPSSRLETLYSHYRQWFMKKTYVFRLVMLVQRQFKHCVSISNTTLDPNGHDSKPPSSRLGNLYNPCSQWFMT